MHVKFSALACQGVRAEKVVIIQWLSNVIRRDLGSAILSILAWSINWLPVGQRELQQLHAEKPYPEGATFLLINLPLLFF